MFGAMFGATSDSAIAAAAVSAAAKPTRTAKDAHRMRQCALGVGSQSAPRGLAHARTHTHTRTRTTTKTLGGFVHRRAHRRKGNSVGTQRPRLGCAAFSLPKQVFGFCRVFASSCPLVLSPSEEALTFRFLPSLPQSHGKVV